MKLLVTPHLGAAASAIALDQKDFVARQIITFTIGELARQHGDPRRFFLLHFLRRFHTALRLLDNQIGELFAVVHMAIEPQFKWRFAHGGDQAHGITAIQALLHLALKLRVEHFGGQDK